MLEIILYKLDLLKTNDGNDLIKNFLLEYAQKRINS